MSLPETFLSKTRETRCTVWIGSTNNKGYGLIAIDGTAKLARRVAYEDEYGPIPEGYVIDHLCRVRNCVNPMHLEAVTSGENSRRGRAAKTLGIGDTCINGHFLTGDNIYTRSTGATECMECRRVGKRANRQGEPRPTVRRSAAQVARDLDATDAVELGESA